MTPQEKNSSALWKTAQDVNHWTWRKLNTLSKKGKEYYNKITDLISDVYTKMTNNIQ